ncbi:MAG TPA: type II toxin-antitoxin system RelE/ParE family toxin [Gemmatimonadales bacterium]|nr:type II toxin-antitoxin system RelE/ParE family toxin [Gemmatimonadales bacterium]
MSWDVEYTDEFATWWEALTEAEQESVGFGVGLLEAKGVHLGAPYSKQIVTSRHTRMRELIVQHQGQPYRILYAFDPRRVAILLVGGSKAGDNRWYEKAVPVADRLYEQHLETLQREGLI